jgi:hypothetical protein
MADPPAVDVRVMRLFDGCVHGSISRRHFLGTLKHFDRYL